MDDNRMPFGWWILPLAILGLIFWGAIAWFFWPKDSASACEPTPITTNTPTGIAGCYRSGDGVASHYGPGNGAAMNFCTWTLRHSTGCGWVTIQSHDTGLVVTVPVVDFCDCFTGTPDERLVDLQYGVLSALGLDPSRGLYPVTVSLGGAPSVAAEPATQPAAPAPAVLPDTAMAP
jgi:hypothetical protein